MGAWIETELVKCGLPEQIVAPRVGAWIETLYRAMALTNPLTSHPVWVRGLKQDKAILWPFGDMSHPVWVRGLKPSMSFEISLLQRSHPVWVRGLKRDKEDLSVVHEGRTPCGCVD